MKGILDIGAWADWFQAVDAAWLFLLALAVVIAVVMFWSRSLPGDKDKNIGPD